MAVSIYNMIQGDTSYADVLERVWLLEKARDKGYVPRIAEDVEAVVENPAASPEQYRLAQAVLSGTARGGRMSKRVAREIVDSTPAGLRSEYSRYSTNPLDAGTRKRMLEFLWQETPKSYRSGRGAGRMVQVRGPAGSALVPIASLTDDEIKTRLGLQTGTANPGTGWQPISQQTNLASLERLEAQYTALGYDTKIKLGPKVRKKVSWQLFVIRGDRMANPADSAAEMYEEFHGRPSRETLEISEEVHEHSHLAALGALVKLKVNCLSGARAVIEFARGDAEDERPILASSEDGRQLYIRGGDQSLDLGVIGMSGSEWLRDSMCVGEITNIEYQTEKGFDHFDLITYYHKLGEESRIRPYLVYDTVNSLMSITGGQYEVKPEGIVN